jgi:DNA adenine methylase
MMTAVLSAEVPVLAVRPFLKWAGGKRRLLDQYAPYFPPLETIHRYYEPFIGGAAVFFHLRPPFATLADRNEKLIEVYQAVQQEVEAVIAALRAHRNEPDYFYEVRAQDAARLSRAERAARLIFLNKTCYNGLFRENSKGKFNVPFGRYKNPRICDEERLRAAAAALQGVDLLAGDFEDVAATAVPGDFLYLDPPYVPLSATSNFTSYDKLGFSIGDHMRLADTVEALTARGCRVMLSNSAAPLVYDLYGRSPYRLLDMTARRHINRNGNGRGPIKELLILNY